MVILFIKNGIPNETALLFRCVVCRDGKALEMSLDHKPEDDIELERIKVTIYVLSLTEQRLCHIRNVKKISVGMAVLLLIDKSKGRLS